MSSCFSNHSFTCYVKLLVSLLTNHSWYLPQNTFLEKRCISLVLYNSARSFGIKWAITIILDNISHCFNKDNTLQLRLSYPHYTFYADGTCAWCNTWSYIICDKLHLCAKRSPFASSPSVSKSSRLVPHALILRSTAHHSLRVINTTTCTTSNVFPCLGWTCTCWFFNCFIRLLSLSTYSSEFVIMESCMVDQSLLS